MEADIPLSETRESNVILDNAVTLIIVSIALLIGATWYFKTDVYGLFNIAYKEVVTLLNVTDATRAGKSPEKDLIPEKSDPVTESLVKQNNKIVDAESELIESEFLPDGTKMDGRYGFEIRRLSGKLEFEPCDRTLQRALYKRLASDKLTRDLANLSFHWAEQCTFTTDTKANLYYDSASKFIRIGELTKAYLSAKKGTEIKPANAQLRLTQAYIESELGLFVESASNYRLGIQLHSDNTTLASTVFVRYAEALTELDEGCEAIDAYRTMLDYKRLRNPESIRQRIGSLSKLYNCGAIKGVRVVIPDGGKNTAPVKVSINGVTGTFILDTGATLTSLTPEFASRSSVELVGKTGRLTTANGQIIVRFAHAKSVSVEGTKVGPAGLVILNSDLGKHDGLLGMNVLSRFDMEKTGNTWVLVTR